MAIRLSICIPTFNRGAYIGQTLNSILCQLTDEVEVVIVDGASKDNTEDVVRSYQRRFPSVRYYRENCNMGVERDTEKAVELARGDHCWLMTSDDVLKRGAVHRTLDALSQGHDLVVVNWEIRNLNLSRLLLGSNLSIQQDRVYGASDWEQFFVDTVYCTSYMGCVVIKKSLWQTRERAPYLDSDFLHVGVIFQSKLQGSAMVVAEPLISVRGGNATWKKRSFEIWAFKWPKLVWSFPELSDMAKQAVASPAAWRHVSRLLFLRACGTFSRRDYDRFVAPIEGEFMPKIVVRTITLLPRVPLNLLISGYARFTRRPLALCELENSPFHWRERLRNLLRRTAIGRTS